MPPTHEPPPEHVCAAFGVRSNDLEPLEGAAWRAGAIVLKPVTDKARAVWQARVLEHLDGAGLRIARPVRSTDGRWIIAGWTAAHYVAGTPQRRGEDVVEVAVTLHRVTTDLPRPEFPDADTGIGARADRLAWGETDNAEDSGTSSGTSTAENTASKTGNTAAASTAGNAGRNSAENAALHETKAGRWFEVLAPARQPVRLANQVVHGELLGSVLFDGDAPAGIVDFVPYYRPAEWAVAVAAVDALTWGGADAALLRRWAHLPEWSQMLLRAMLFRLAEHALSEDATDAELDALRATAREVSALL